jgi:uncharacterized membrane protein YeaQ/YmgE (transglycosylase-associated protein family)
VSGLAILFVVLLVLFALLIVGTYNLVGLVVYLIVAAIVGWIADAIVPGRLPYGWLGAITAGLLGSYLGAVLLGSIGPTVAGIPLISAIIGAIIVAFLFRLLFGSMRHDTTSYP